ncbi:sigma-70 family RNA polymerase sigma factor [Rathayibacter sp. VKM Ac-2801]|uniref:sigma-70 family RNA polymerase sigma factor n=1 Tax=Rathayibacter sp. VKM Ac-2801 TaxID=2609255 RepID=UPI00131F624E|nr:sigma-70 family RNA polymerase sigma factor [Rathayibacter sp. VKM Ac-2801]QHC71052.1 sigma-70 family RNA polymerase sigma factor [Rathayibacter sp. VKM Ac-2801]
MGPRRRSERVDGRSDEELVALVREGRTDAVSELWRRHSSAGRTVARAWASSSDPDDLVSEAFLRVLRAIERGGGPEGAFRPYFFAAVRNVAGSWARRGRHERPFDEADRALPSAGPDPEAHALAALERDLGARAFRALPPRWQEVLWYTEVEGLSPAAAAPLMGLRPNAVAALGVRAREGLRSAWIREHVADASATGECGWVLERAGTHARGRLPARDRLRIDRHLDGCLSCREALAEAESTARRLASVLLPLTAGLSGAAAWAAGRGSGTASGPPPSAVRASRAGGGAGVVVAASAAAAVAGVVGAAVLLSGSGNGAVVAAVDASTQEEEERGTAEAAAPTSSGGATASAGGPETEPGAADRASAGADGDPASRSGDPGSAPRSSVPDGAGGAASDDAGATRTAPGRTGPSPQREPSPDPVGAPGSSTIEAAASPTPAEEPATSRPAAAGSAAPVPTPAVTATPVPAGSPGAPTGSSAPSPGGSTPSPPSDPVRPSAPIPTPAPSTPAPVPTPAPSTPTPVATQAPGTPAPATTPAAGTPTPAPTTPRTPATPSGTPTPAPSEPPAEAAPTLALDTDGRLLPDAGGTAAPGAEVLLEDASDGRRYGAATSDAAGSWTVPALPLPAGTTTVLARTAAGVSAPVAVDLRAPVLLARAASSGGVVGVLVLADPDADGLDLLVDGERVRSLAPGAPVVAATLQVGPGRHTIGVRYSTPDGRTGPVAVVSVDAG